jgi:hypothetical protein
VSPPEEGAAAAFSGCGLLRGCAVDTGLGAAGAAGAGSGSSPGCLRDLSWRTSSAVEELDEGGAAGADAGVATDV